MTGKPEAISPDGVSSATGQNSLIGTCPISPFLDRFRVAGSSPASMSEIAIFQQLASQPEVGDVEE